MHEGSGAEPGGPSSTLAAPGSHHPPPRQAPPSPGRCRLRARSRFTQRSGSCSVVSKGSPSSTMLSRNWAKGVPRCSRQRGTPRSAAQPHRPPRPASLGSREPWGRSMRPRSGGPQPSAGRGLPAVSWAASCLLTVVCVGHCLAHGEDHGQDEGGVTEFLMVCRGAEQAVRAPTGGGNPPQGAGSCPSLAHPACLSACPAPAPRAARTTRAWR